MRYSTLSAMAGGKLIKSYESLSHEYLIRAGFVDQVSSGVYTLLPLGLRVIKNISSVVRNEMDQLGVFEILMSSLHPRSFWDQTKRWHSVDDLFTVKSRYKSEYALAPTHEETVTPLAQKMVRSYKDLPLGFYQIGVKFRDEARPKSGILRGREFIMKDLYSFHLNSQDFESFYARVKEAYFRIFARLGFTEVKLTEASGGSFSQKYSHEFNVLTCAGEVDLIYCDSCTFAQNQEITKDKEKDPCAHCRAGVLHTGRAIEVGNIFDLGTRFSEAFEFAIPDATGENHLVHMGCYGIGITRVMGALVEVSCDKKGMRWGREVAPFSCHLVNLIPRDSSFADVVYRTLSSEKIEVLYDDRMEVSLGEKLTLADLVGIPVRLVVSVRTKGQIEWKERDSEKAALFSVHEVIDKLKELSSYEIRSFTSFS